MTDSRLCLALDVPTLSDAVIWTQRCSETFGVFKVGLELYCAEGPGVIERLRLAGAREIFLDLKLHDIPKTVERAITRLRDLGVDYLTVHTSGGHEMLSAASEAAGAELQLLGVTVLTSLDGDAMLKLGMHDDLATHVVTRATLALESGVSGLVCSALEASRIRASLGDQPFIVTPGIRFPGSASDDQRRVTRPRDALAGGADLLVIGRTVTASANPEDAMARLRAEVSA